MFCGILGLVIFVEKKFGLILRMVWIFDVDLIEMNEEVVVVVEGEEEKWDCYYDDEIVDLRGRGGVWKVDCLNLNDKGLGIGREKGRMGEKEEREMIIFFV